MDAEEALYAIPSIVLLRPDIRDAESRPVFDVIRRLAPSLSHETICRLIGGSSWRERLVGYAFAVMCRPEGYVDEIVRSLASPRGLAIVPGLAVIVLGVRDAGGKDLPGAVLELDRTAFSGEVGWAIDKARFVQGASKKDPGELSPNDGLTMEQYVGFYDWLREGGTLPGMGLK